MRALAPAVLVAVVVGCVHTNAAVLDPTTLYQKTCSKAVQVYTSAGRVPSAYREVALLASKGESSWTDERGMITSQRKKAAQVGANGIILGETAEPKAGTKIIGALFGTGAERKGKAIAIWIPEDSARTMDICSGKNPTPSASHQRLIEVDRPVEQRAYEPAPAPQRSELPAPTPAPASASTRETPPARAPTPTRVSAPAPMPIPVSASAPRRSSEQAEVKAFIPPGIQYVADVTSMYAYHVSCRKVEEIPQVNRYFYENVRGAQEDGYVIAGC
jgi:hypothetical protein